MSDTPAPSVDAEYVSRLVAEVVRRVRGAAAGSSPAAPPAPAGEAASRAVLTPSARERAADAGIEIVRRQPAGAAAAAPGRPFLVAHAACAADAVGRAAGIVRAVAGAARLPAAGLADVLAALALHAGRDGARGVLLTGRPALAVAAANRHASLRAVTGPDAARLRSAAAECAANLLVIDPAAVTAAVLERLCGELAHGPDLAPPAELAGGDAHSTPCGCRSAHH